MNRNGINSVIVFSAAFLVAPAGATELGLSVYADISQNDNAFRNEEKLSETQNEIGGDISIEENQKKNYFYSVNYGSTYTKFAEGSQESRSFVEGGSSLRLGKENGLFALYADHSKSRTLIDNTQPDILDNSDEREIINVRPVINLPLSSVDRLILSGNLNTVGYAQEELMNSETKGVAAEWSHSLSSVSQIGVNYTQADTEYTELDGYEYAYQSYFLYYRSTLRRMTYDFSYGYNSTEQNGEEFNSPSYQLAVTYNSPRYTITANFQNMLTDTSMGDGNNTFNFNQKDSFLDSTAKTPDQYEFTYSGVSFTTDALCLRCNLRVDLGRSSRKYKETTEENSVDTFVSAALEYTFKNASSLSYQYRLNHSDFELAGAEDAKDSSHELSYQMDFKFGLLLSAYIERRNRDAGESQNYSEGVTGLRAVYEIL